MKLLKSNEPMDTMYYFPVWRVDHVFVSALNSFEILKIVLLIANANAMITS